MQEHLLLVRQVWFIRHSRHCVSCISHGGRMSRTSDRTGANGARESRRANGLPHESRAGEVATEQHPARRGATALRNAPQQTVQERMFTPEPYSMDRYGDFGISHPLRPLRSVYFHRQE